VIADNKLALNAGWDEEMLRIELEELKALDFDLALTGFDAGELEALFADGGETSEGQGVGDAVPAPRPEAISKPGDVWVLGRHRVMCGDSTSIDAAGVLMGGGMADLLITDPPYNVAYEGKTEDALTIQNDAMSDVDFRQFLRDCYATADAFMRPGAAFYIWHADSEGLNFRAAAQEVGWKVRQCLIWNKNSLVLGRQDYHWKHEPCLYGWKDGAAHYWGSDRAQTTVLDFNRPARNGEHPTMKPIDLIQYQVENSSKRGWVVLDLFGGSGSTLIACEKTARCARLMELDPHYADVIVRRWQNFTGQRATHLETGDPFPEASDGVQ
jgi:site-specific DNA-methyltransferase (adenine-specific)